MDLIEFRRSLRRHARVGLVVAILVLVFGLFTIGGSQVNYAATSTVLVTPRAEVFQQASASVLRVILPNVIVVVLSNSLRDAAKPNVPANYRDVPVVVSAAFDANASTLFVTAQSKDPTAAVVWSAAIARALTERMKGDKYLGVQVLDVAEGAGPTGKKVRILGIVASFAFAFLAFVLVAFGMQRFEESRDVAGALRKRGVRVLGTLAPSRRSRRRADHLSVIQAALAPEERDDGPLVVTALTDEHLSLWLAARLGEGVSEAESDGRIPALELQSDPTPRRERAALRPLTVVAGPAVEQLSLRAASDGYRVCVMAVDDRMSSVADVVAGVQMLKQAGIDCRGVVLIPNARHLRPKANPSDESVVEPAL